MSFAALDYDLSASVLMGIAKVHNWKNIALVHDFDPVKNPACFNLRETLLRRNSRMGSPLNIILYPVNATRPISYDGMMSRIQTFARSMHLFQFKQHLQTDFSAVVFVLLNQDDVRSFMVLFRLMQNIRF